MAKDKDKDPIATKIATTVATVAAGWVAQQVVSQIWKKASGKSAPKNLDDPDVSITSAVIFAALAAGVGVLARRLATQNARKVMGGVVAKKPVHQEAAA